MSFQNDYQRRNFNTKPFRAHDPNVLRPLRELVPQNNLAQEKEWCYLCSQPHNQTICMNKMENQALVVHNSYVGQENLTNRDVEKQVNSKIALVNW